MPRTPSDGLRSTTHLAVVRDTGEVLDVEMPVTRGRRRKGRRKVYALLEIENIGRLRNLRASEWAILHTIMGAVNAETNEAAITQKMIADTLGVFQPSVARGMKVLMDRRIVHYVRHGVYRVNAHIMFRGSNQDWDIATETEEEPEW